MSFGYYQQQPGWGSQGYQMAAPPQPVFQPQAGWGANQFFRAQVGSLWDDYDDYRDEGFFDGIFRGIKDVFSRGVSREEAIRWHGMVYGGQAPISSLGPREIGAAAGYEAVRHWATYRGVYTSPLGSDRHRQKEALAGLAAGEAAKLISYSTNPRSRHTRHEAAEIAAATAERIYAEEYDDPYEVFESSPYRRNVLRRRRSSGYFGGTRPPLVASSTGSGYLPAQSTGVSYVSAQPTGVSYVSAGTPSYTGTPGYTVASPGVQYVQATGSPYVQTPQYVGTPGVTYATTGQPLQYATTGGVQYAQPQYAQAGYQVQYAGQPQYAAQAQYAAQPQYVQATGAQVVYPSTTGQQYMTVPQGYTRARALSTGYSPYVQY